LWTTWSESHETFEPRLPSRSSPAEPCALRDVRALECSLAHRSDGVAVRRNVCLSGVRPPDPVSQTASLAQAARDGRKRVKLGEPSLITSSLGCRWPSPACVVQAPLIEPRGEFLGRGLIPLRHGDAPVRCTGVGNGQGRHGVLPHLVKGRPPPWGWPSRSTPRSLSADRKGQPAGGAKPCWMAQTTAWARCLTPIFR
jgi:hypothetical protein